MNGSIIFKGKYGATRQYAEWLGKELNLPILLPEDVDREHLEWYRYLLIGTSVYFGKFKIADWLKKNVHALKNKKLFLFIVNGTAPEEEALRSKFVRDNVPGEIRQQCEIFFLPGRLIHKELTFADQLILKIGGTFEKDPRKKAAMHSDMDGVKRENLIPLISAVNHFYSVSTAQETRKP